MVNKKKEIIEDFEEQYYILKEEETKETRRRIRVLTVINVLILIVCVVAASLMFKFYNHIKGMDNEEVDTEIVNRINMLTIEYSPSERIRVVDASPQWRSTPHIITITNKGTLNFSYKLVWEDITNELEEAEDFIVIVKRNDTEILRESLPNANNDIFEFMNIDANTTHRYEIIIEYVKDEEREQSVDVNGFSAKIRVVKETK